MISSGSIEGIFFPLQKSQWTTKIGLQQTGVFSFKYEHLRWYNRERTLEAGQKNGSEFALKLINGDQCPNHTKLPRTQQTI